MAAALLLQLDTYLRTHDLLSLRGVDLIAPQPCAGRNYSKSWILVVDPMKRNLETKTGLTDLSLIVGDHRPWLVPMLHFLKRSGNGLMFRFNHAAYSAALQRSIHRLNFDVKLTPHVLRHSGASNDRFHGLRDLEQIRRRGFWKSMVSVEVYEKHALIQQSLQRLTISQQAACRQSEAAMAKTIRTAFK